MPSFKVVEDRPTPKEVYNLRIWGCAAVAASAAIMIGYDSAFVGGAITLKGFLKDFGTLDPNTSANLVTTYQAGAFFGAFMGYPLGFFAGRKWGLMTCALLFTIGSIVMICANGNTGLAPIYAGRAVAGLAIGAASSLAPTYISEISVASIRGQLVGLYEIGWQLGGIVGFFINYGVSLHIPISTRQWVVPFAVQIIPGGMLVLGCFFLVESPRWLVSRGRNADAVRALSKLRKLDAMHPYMIEEMGEMEQAYEKERGLLGGSTSFWAPFVQIFTTKSTLWRLVLGSSLFAFQNGTGINAINYYSPTVFKSLGIVGANTGLLTTGIFGVIKTLGAFVWIWLLIDRIGRRKILMTGSIGGAICMLAIAIYIAVDKPASHSGQGIDSAGRFSIACFYIWTIFYGASWNGTPWVVGSEIFPMQSRSLGMVFMAASNWLYNFAIARATPVAFLNIGWGFYLIFACLMFISVPWIFFMLPETKGIPLEKMDDLFKTRPVWRANEIVHASLAELHAADFAAIERSQNRGGAGLESGSLGEEKNGSGEAVDSLTRDA
ncbi:general substrate transporter [Microstroma glucosiphilum]|uniref:Quinate transporter n=1 Tax=Pseudomicrostroma glucosiphilum TaxID=1684307 RepID=A0A316U5G1_9BASI|nr:general substrate transporter [Pseudomicrostroma glucosiphilum]PWN20466.1 general substrate transporter [Pseudomicrostroma glucosiphilum]